MKTGKMLLKLCIFLLVHVHDHACMMYAMCHVYTPYIMAKPKIYLSFSSNPRHPTVEIHNSYIEFHIWSASVHQHYLSFLAADFARNKEKATLQKQKRLKGREGYPNSLSCVLLDTLFRP